MNKVNCNSHKNNPEHWSFIFDANIEVVTTKFVLSGEQPIVEILHWDDGGWQFMCNTTDDSNDGRVVCMGCLFDKYPWISMFKDLQKGYLAFFDEIDKEWSIEEIDVS